MSPLRPGLRTGRPQAPVTVKTAQSAKHKPQCGQEAHEIHACRILGREMLAAKSYFWKTGLERVPIAVPAPASRHSTKLQTHSSAVRKHKINMHAHTWPEKCLLARVISPFRSLVALRHLSVKTAQSAKHIPQCGQEAHGIHACRLLAREMLAAKSYFGKTGLERVPIAAPAPSPTSWPSASR
jgi:hypothetical protein